MHRTILSLCDRTGNWSRPYEAAGYEVIRVDLHHGQDVRLLKFPGRVHGILAAPPCTHFATSGARWWPAKGDAALIEGLAVVDACLRIVTVCQPEWWALENPRGRLKDYLGPRKFSFQPCDFGDPYTKRTHLWGHFTPPAPLYCPSAVAVEPTLGSITHFMPGNRPNKRSDTPMGFANAFFEANP